MEQFTDEELRTVWQAVYSKRAELKRGITDFRDSEEIEVLNALLRKIFSIERIRKED